MELQHVNVKMFVDGPMNVDAERFIEIFHAWIKDHALDGLLIDVADYRHVPAGPGVMLIGLEGDYNMDHTGERWGLRYNRKAALDGTNEDRFRQAVNAAAKACHLLEETLASEGPLTFSRQEFELCINDRAIAPNTSETLSACQPDIESFLSNLLGHHDFTIDHNPDPRSLFRFSIKSAKLFDLKKLASDLTQ